METRQYFTGTSGTAAKVLSRIENFPEGKIFFPSNFRTDGSRAAVDMALKRLLEMGKIRSVGRGMYDKPRYNEVLAAYSPPTKEEVLEALRAKYRYEFQYTGDLAVNSLGLSEQVPASINLISNAPSKLFKIGGRAIHVKHAPARRMALKGIASLVAEAVWHLHRNGNIDEKYIHKLQKTLSDEDKTFILSQLELAPDWMVPHLKKLSSK